MEAALQCGIAAMQGYFNFYWTLGKLDHRLCDHGTCMHMTIVGNAFIVAASGLRLDLRASSIAIAC